MQARARPVMRGLLTGTAMRLLLCVALFVIFIFVAPPSAGLAEPIPLTLDLIGYVSALCLSLMAGLPIRIRAGRLSGVLSVVTHRRFGWLALSCAAVHAVGYLLMLPQTLVLLTPYGSWHMLGALAALILLGWMIVSSLDRPRRRLHRTAAGFRAWHIILSASIVFLVSVHIAASALLMNARWKIIAWALCSALAVLAVLRRSARVSR